jgi:hypothetical protein
MESAVWRTADVTDDDAATEKHAVVSATLICTCLMSAHAHVPLVEPARYWRYYVLGKSGRMRSNGVGTRVSQ